MERATSTAPSAIASSTSEDQAGDATIWRAAGAASAARGLRGAGRGGLAVAGHERELRIGLGQIGDRLGGALGDLAHALLGDARLVDDEIGGGDIEQAALDDLAIALQPLVELLQLLRIDAVGGEAQAGGEASDRHRPAACARGDAASSGG